MYFGARKHCERLGPVASTLFYTLHFFRVSLRGINTPKLLISSEKHFLFGSTTGESAPPSSFSLSLFHLLFPFWLPFFLFGIFLFPLFASHGKRIRSFFLFLSLSFHESQIFALETTLSSSLFSFHFPGQNLGHSVVMARQAREGKT